MRQSKRALLGATILTSITLLTSTGASAQDAPLTPLGRIVLGTGINDTVAIDTPQAVTVLNQEDIDDQQASTIGELFELVPGVQATGSGRALGESYNIRGIGTGLSSDESRIIVNLDGAPKYYEQYRLGSFFSDPLLFREVEVLRGPASSTLYGSGAIGGVINVETRDPSEFLENSDRALSTRLSYGTNGDEFTTSVIGAQRVNDSFETLLALSYRENGNYEDGSGNDVLGLEAEALSGLAKARYVFGSDHGQSLTFSYLRTESDNDDQSLDQITGLNPFFGTVDREIIDETWAVKYENEFLGNNLLDLDITLNYTDTQNTQRNPSAACSPGFGAVICDSDYSYATTSLRVENVSEFSSENFEAYVTTGLQLSSQEREGVADTLPGIFDPSAATFHPEGTDEKIGIYAQGELIFNDRLTIIPGIRIDRVFLSSEEDFVSGVDLTDSNETLVSPKIAVAYEVNDTYSFFGSVAQTERAPTIDERFTVADPDGTGDTFSINLEPETATNAEFGIAASYFGVFSQSDALDVKATAFYYDIENYIQRIGTTTYENVDRAEISGVEIEAAYESDRFFARAAYSDISGDDTNGDALTSIAARNLNLTLGAQNRDLGVRYGVQSAIYDDITYSNGEEFSGYAVHDLFVNWEPQQGALVGVDVGFRINNAFDRDFQNSLIDIPGEGRSYEVSLEKTFEF